MKRKDDRPHKKRTTWAVNPITRYDHDRKRKQHKNEQLKEKDLVNEYQESDCKYVIR